MKNKLFPKTFFQSNMHNLPIKLVTISIITFLLLFNTFISIAVQGGNTLILNSAPENSTASAITERPILSATLRIEEVISQAGTIPTDKFLSGQNLNIKAKVNHSNGSEHIVGVYVTIIKISDNHTLVPPRAMEVSSESSGPDWKWFKFSYTLPIPTPRGEYNITVQAFGNTTDYPPEIISVNYTIEIKVFNSYPEIKGNIDPIYKEEDDPDWILDMSKNKSDLEDPQDNLTWQIENVNESLLNIEIIKDNLVFSLIPNASGSNQLTLYLLDTEGNRDFLRFWIYVTPINDPPVFTSRIPNQVKAEDSAQWTVNLSDFIYDVEDSKVNRFLNWTVSGIDESIIDIKINKNSTGNFLTIIPVNDAHGSNLITVRAIDSGDTSIAQRVWINLTSVNDPPKWAPIPTIHVSSHESRGLIQLFDYISDLDTPKESLIFKIKSKTPEFIEPNIVDGNLDLKITDRDYTGSGTLTLSADDGDTEVLTTINLTIYLGKFTVHLLAPENTSIISYNVLWLYWTVENPANIEPIYFDIYLQAGEMQPVLSHDIKARKKSKQLESWFNYEKFLENEQIWYWTVVPIYIDEQGVEYIGKASEGVRSFRVSFNSTNQPPFTTIISPINGISISNQTVNLTWLGYDPDNDDPISYELFFGTDSQAVFQREGTVRQILQDPAVNNFKIGNLKEDMIYYWTVIPTAKGQQGNCLSGVSSFGVDLENNEPCTFLLLPKNNITVSKPPILYWEFIDPDPFEDIAFDIYIHEDLSYVTSLDISAYKGTVKKTTSFYFPELDPKKMYYWTVVGYDKGGTGICESGVWSFVIDENKTNYPPVVMLNSPTNQVKIYKDTIQLYWNGSDIDSDQITFTLYFGDDYQSVSTKQNQVKIGKITRSSFKINNLTHGKWYYWTVIPDDGSVPGICLDRVWSFKVDLENSPEKADDDQSSRTMISIIIIVLVIIITFLFSIFWRVRKRRLERGFKKYLQADSISELPSDVKASLLSTKTLRAIHFDKSIEPDGTGIGSTRLKLEAENDGKSETFDEEISTSISEEVVEDSSQPYINGDYPFDISKSRYKPKTKYAAHVRRAIPYARSSEQETQISSKSDFELAKPLMKKISTDAPLKASSLPITKECPECGSFKVKTYQDGISKCLDCKFTF